MSFFVRTAGYRHALMKPRSVRAEPTLVTVSADEVDNVEPDHVDLASCSRCELPAASDAAALRDPEFCAHVAAGDGHRDAGAWAESEASYSAALALYPYQPGYWVQQGHVSKEQGRFAAAEIAYRTAAALGVPPDGLTEHLRFVIAKQDCGDAVHPIRFAAPGETAQLVPTRSDVLLLARLLWRAHAVEEAETLGLLRMADSLDMLFAVMVADTRFAKANVQWLSVMRDGDLA